MTQNTKLPSGNALPDQLVFGLSGDCTNAAPPDLEKVRAALEARGARISRQSNPAAVRAQLPLRDERGGDVGWAQLDLHFVNSSAGWRLGDRSSIRLNPQTIAREMLRDDYDCGDEGFGNTKNIIAGAVTGPELRDWLVGSIEYSFIDSLDAFESASGAKLDGDAALWLKTVEVCRDLPRTDAVADMHVLKGTMLVQSVGKLIDAYHPVKRTAFQNAEGLISLRFLPSTGRIAFKVYAKRRDILRLELACPDRSAVAALTGRDRLPPSGKNARQLVASAMAAAEPLLDRLQGHVEAALASKASPAELMTELQDLVRLAAGHPAPRGPAPSPASIQHAKDALNGLVSDGWFSASGIPANLPVRKVLEKLVGSDGVLARRPGQSVYCLHPRFAAATQAMS